MRKIESNCKGGTVGATSGLGRLVPYTSGSNYYRPFTFDSFFLFRDHTFQARTAKIASHSQAMEILSDPREPRNRIAAGFLQASTLTSAKRCVASPILAALLSLDLKH
jgi:hypothetical protein